MTANPGDYLPRFRWMVYLILITISVGGMTGRLLSVNAVNRIELEQHLINQDLRREEQKLRQQALSADVFEKKLAETRERITAERQLQRPFLSANDRSRWLAIRALVEQGTYQIDDLIDHDLWNTIDMVQHRGRDGQLHLYSSKPPLLITLLAGEYWLIYHLTGWSLGAQPYLVGRLMLFTINILPLAWLFVMVAQLAERYARTDWARLFVVAAVCFGTFLTTFAVTLNNHTVGAVSAGLTLVLFTRIWCEGSQRPWDWAACGLAAAFTATNELPALALVALVALALVIHDYRRCLRLFLPAALAVMFASLGTNYAAHGTLSPPYAHRNTRDPAENWYLYTYTVDGVQRASYWMDRQGIDRGESSKLVYAWHTLLGHHGVFSLTPLWLLSLWGLACWIRTGKPRQRQVAAGILLLSLVCLVFYVGLRPLQDRNYGGMTSGFRWMFWFAPLWLWGMLPAVDRLAANRTGRAIGLILLGLSVLSASYPTWNPWTHPWIYQGLQALGGG